MRLKDFRGCLIILNIILLFFVGVVTGLIFFIYYHRYCLLSESEYIGIESSIISSDKGFGFLLNGRCSFQKIKVRKIAYFDVNGRINCGSKVLIGNVVFNLSYPVPMIAIVIDDFGWSYEVAELFLDLPFVVTWSILPYEKYSKEVFNLAQKWGVHRILHLPMEAVGDSPYYPNVIKANMSKEQIAYAVKKAILYFDGDIEGVNNHRGSLVTKDENLMCYVLSVLKRYNLYFLDSFTVPGSIAYKVARRMGLRCAYNKLFLDNSSEVKDIKCRIYQLIGIAKRDKWAVGIAHARFSTFKALLESAEYIEKSGVSVVPLATIVDYLYFKNKRK